MFPVQAEVKVPTRGVRLNWGLNRKENRILGDVVYHAQTL